MLRTVQFNLPPKSPKWDRLIRNCPVGNFKVGPACRGGESLITPPIWGVGGLQLSKSGRRGVKLTKRGVWGLLLLLPFFISSCTKQSGNHLFTLMPASVTHADFI